jgi:hypothetical protein
MMTTMILYLVLTHQDYHLWLVISIIINNKTVIVTFFDVLSFRCHEGIGLFAFLLALIIIIIIIIIFTFLSILLLLILIILFFMFFYEDGDNNGDNDGYGVTW